jgi:putative phosphoribosyl transferase
MRALRRSRFTDRAEAGRRLAERLDELRGQPVVVLGLPRGGVPVAAEVAQALSAPLDVMIVRKLGVPFQRELAMGAIAEGGLRVLNPDVISIDRVTEQQIADVEARERVELERRGALYRDDRPRQELRDRTVVIVDDGVATGATARVACVAARAAGAARVVLAVPVAPSGWIAAMADAADEYVCVLTPHDFASVGQFYTDFSEVSDDEVRECLRAATSAGAAENREHPMSAGHSARAAHPQPVTVQVGALQLPGDLTIPPGAPGVVLFAHGSGSSRHSVRNRWVASRLNAAGLATLLFDLLSPAEEPDRANVFDIELLAQRLSGATDWLRTQPVASGSRIGYFGASTGAAAALWAAASRTDVDAIVSRGGRADLAWPKLRDVRAPTLLIVGGADRSVLALNEKAHEQLRCESRLVVIPGAGHLFEESGALAAVSEAAVGWFRDHLAEGRDSGTG